MLARIMEGLASVWTAMNRWRMRFDDVIFLGQSRVWRSAEHSHAK